VHDSEDQFESDAPPTLEDLEARIEELEGHADGATSAGGLTFWMALAALGLAAYAVWWK
jgi:hypothetical protein